MRDAENLTPINSLSRYKTEADVLAAEFVRLHGGDKGLMLAWFARAIKVGLAAGQSARKRASGEISITAGFLPPSVDSIRASMMACLPTGCRPR